MEEQFYLFWPLIILVSLRLLTPAAAVAGGRRRGHRLAGAGPAVDRHRRAVGVLLAADASLAARASAPSSPSACCGCPSARRRSPASALVWLGLGLIAVGVVVIGKDTPYPGVAAIIPVVGTAMVIMGGSHASTLPSRLLSTTGSRVGSAASPTRCTCGTGPSSSSCPSPWACDSLAFNLWLVVVAGHRLGQHRARARRPSARAGCCPCAPRKSVIVAVTASVMVAAGALAWGALSGGPDGRRARSTGMCHRLARRLPEPVRSGPVPDGPDAAANGAYWDLPDGYADDCHLDFPEVEPPACTYGPEDAGTTVLLLGDSHAQQWLPALQRLADERELAPARHHQGGLPDGRGHRLERAAQARLSRMRRVARARSRAHRRGGPGARVRSPRPTCTSSSMGRGTRLEEGDEAGGVRGADRGIWAA